MSSLNLGASFVASAVSHHVTVPSGSAAGVGLSVLVPHAAVPATSAPATRPAVRMLRRRIKSPQWLRRGLQGGYVPATIRSGPTFAKSLQEVFGNISATGLVGERQSYLCAHLTDTSVQRAYGAAHTGPGKDLLEYCRPARPGACR